MSPMLVVYLDVDGTILYDPRDGTDREDLDFQLVCDGLEEMLDFVLAHCKPYWLTNRARLGSSAALAARLFPHLPACARRILPTYWDNYKYEGVDLAQPFVWFDDDPEDEDLDWLECQNRLDSFVRMDPANRQNPRRILAEIKTRMGR